MEISWSRPIRIIMATAVFLTVGELTLASPPFAGVNPEPTTSPYLQLYQQYPQQSVTQNQSVYQTIIRPRLANIQRAADQQSQLLKVEAQQQALKNSRRLPPPLLGPPPTKLGASRNIRSTGHQTRFLDGRRFQDQTHYFPSRIIR